MSEYYVKKISVKKPESQWFMEVSEENTLIMKKSRDWIKAQPGFISNSFFSENENTIVVYRVFQTQEEYEEMWQQLEEKYLSDPDFIKIKEWQDNNIISITTQIGSEHFPDNA